MRPILLLLLALVALVAGVAAQTDCGLRLTSKHTSRASKSRRSRKGQAKLGLKYQIKNRSRQDLVDVAFEIALPQGVRLTKGKFSPPTPNPAPVLAGDNATWLGIPIKTVGKTRIKVTVDAAGYTGSTPLVFHARAFRHDGTAPLPCVGSSVESQA